MTAHTEKQRIHILDEYAKIKIVKKFRRILDGNVSDDEVKIVHWSKYIEIGFAFFMDIVRIQSYGVELPESLSLSVAILIQNIHV